MNEITELKKENYYFIKALDHCLDIHQEESFEDLWISFIGKFKGESEHYYTFHILEYSTANRPDVFQVLKKVITEIKTIKILPK